MSEKDNIKEKYPGLIVGTENYAALVDQLTLPALDAIRAFNELVTKELTSYYEAQKIVNAALKPTLEIIRNYIQQNNMSEGISQLIKEQNKVFQSIRTDYYKSMIEGMRESLSYLASSNLDYSSFVIPSEENVIQLEQTIECVSDLTEAIDISLNSNSEYDLPESQISTLNFDVEFPKDISIAKMESVVTGDSIEDEPIENFDYATFELELKALDFTNNLENVMVRYSNLIVLTNECIDSSLKQKVYETMFNGAIELFSKGLGFVALIIFLVVLNHYLKDLIIYKSFIELIKEAKKTFKD